MSIRKINDYIKECCKTIALKQLPNTGFNVRVKNSKRDTGTECCTVIPVRGGNGAMEELAKDDRFSPPASESLEKVLEYGIGLIRGRVFADTWDLKLFSSCSECFRERVTRLTEMNLTQMPVPEIKCSCNQLAY